MAKQNLARKSRNNVIRSNAIVLVVVRRKACTLHVGRGVAVVVGGRIQIPIMTST